MVTKDTNSSQNPSELKAKITTAARKQLRPDGTAYHTLLFPDECNIVNRTKVSHKEVQIAALSLQITPERYCRNQNTLSMTDQIRLLQSHVAVIGLGGLGGSVTEILARIGIGHLRLVDGDCFEESNLNRQLLSTSENLGEMKAEVAAARVRAINPAVETDVVGCFLKQDNSLEIMQGVDLACDCLDTIGDRFILEHACRQLNIPMVSAAIGGASGQATVILPGDEGLKHIYGKRQLSPNKGIETTLGTLPYAAIAIAAIECAEIIALVLGKPAQLQNRLLLADFRYLTMDTISLG